MSDEKRQRPRVSFTVNERIKGQMQIAASRESRTVSSWIRWLIRRELLNKGLLRES